MNGKVKHPSITLKRKAVELGICQSMDDAVIMDLLVKAKVVKNQREVFMTWFRHKYPK